MPQSLAQVYVHIIFSTKERHPYLRPTIEPELYAYMGDTIKRVGGIPHLINGTSDHIHLLSSLPRTLALSKYIEDMDIKFHDQDIYDYFKEQYPDIFDK